MEIIYELLVEALIVQFFGKRIRYLFFKLIRKPKTINYLEGKPRKMDSSDTVSQHLWNVIVGLMSFTLISIVAAYIVYTYF